MTENIPVPTVRELLSFRPLPCLGVTAQVMILVGLYLLSIATFYWSVRVTGTLG